MDGGDAQLGMAIKDTACSDTEGCIVPTKVRFIGTQGSNARRPVEDVSQLQYTNLRDTKK